MLNRISWKDMLVIVMVEIELSNGSYLNRSEQYFFAEMYSSREAREEYRLETLLMVGEKPARRSRKKHLAQSPGTCWPEVVILRELFQCSNMTVYRT